MVGCVIYESVVDDSCVDALPVDIYVPGMGLPADVREQLARRHRAARAPAGQLAAPGAEEPALQVETQAPLQAQPAAPPEMRAPLQG